MGSLDSEGSGVVLERPKSHPLYSPAWWGDWPLDCSLDEHGLLFAIYSSSVSVPITTKQPHWRGATCRLVSYRTWKLSGGADQPLLPLSVATCLLGYLSPPLFLETYHPK